MTNLEFVNIWGCVGDDNYIGRPNAFIERINENYHTDPNPGWRYHCIFFESGDHYCFDGDFDMSEWQFCMHIF